jgi:hypothetical protein
MHIYYGNADARADGLVKDLNKDLNNDGDETLEGELVNVGDYNGDGYLDALSSKYIRYGREVELTTSSNVRVSR